MKIEVVFGILSRIGFSSISRETLNTEVLELEVLLAQNQSNQQTFVEYISNIDADGVQELCDVPGFVELLRRSCTRHDLVFPGFDSYTMVCAKDRKQLGGDVENGLYNYIDKFIAELQMPFKSMKRKDFSKAYILQLQVSISTL